MNSVHGLTPKSAAYLIQLLKSSMNSNMSRGRMLVEMAVGKEKRKIQFSTANSTTNAVDARNRSGAEELVKAQTISNWISNSKFDEWLSNVDYNSQNKAKLNTCNEPEVTEASLVEINLNQSLDSFGTACKNYTINDSYCTSNKNIPKFNEPSSKKFLILQNVVIKSATNECVEASSNVITTLKLDNKKVEERAKSFNPPTDVDTFHLASDHSSNADNNIEDFCTPEYKFDNISSESSGNSLEESQEAMCVAAPISVPHQSWSEKTKIEKNKVKKIHCKYCEQDIDTKNFMRHLKRNHKNDEEVRKIFEYPKNSKDRKHALSFLRNETNFNLYIKGTIRPSRQLNKSVQGADYYPCIYCKALLIKGYLRRHLKICKAFEGRKEKINVNHISQSQTMIACASDPTNVISTLNVRKQVFDIMKSDTIAFEVKKDLLIAHCGNSYLKKHRRERMAYACSIRMRELARLLINFRLITNRDKICLKDLLHPQNFDAVITSVRNISGYDPIKKTFTSPSLAMHLGTSLKLACDELTQLILKGSDGFKCNSTDKHKAWLQNVKHFKKLIESRWNIELGSIANKDLQEKRWTKPLLLPLVEDLKKFREETIEIANRCMQLFIRDQDDGNTYKEFVQCILALLIVFNRRRIGDVQFLKIKDYQSDKKTDYTDFDTVLTQSEKMLTKKYKRVISCGKGSRAVVILVPEMIQNFLSFLLEKRSKYISSDNEYVFATPGSRINWGKGDVAIRSLTKKIKLKNPHAISSNKLRKQIATVMQILNLSKDDTKQFSVFMGHTQKTHEEFYELPVDIYQTAKVSKILLMMEKGCLPTEYKGKALSQINFDYNLEFAEEENNIGSKLLTSNETLLTSTPSFEGGEIILHCGQTTNTSQEEMPEEIIRGEHHNTGFETDCDSDITERQNITRHTQRKGWSDVEIRQIKDSFMSFIESDTYPSTRDIKTFLDITKINRNVPTVKAKIQHLKKLRLRSQINQ